MLSVDKRFRLAMIKTVKRTEVNINVGDYFPEPSDLEAKYGLNQSEVSSEGNTPTPAAGSNAKYDEAAYKRKLVEKNRKIESLCVLLEALEPIPNMNPEKYKQIIDNDIEDNVDFRDSKIVALAKKSHKLTMLLNKEKTEKEELNGVIQTLGKKNVLLSEQLEVAKASRQPDVKPYGRNQQTQQLADDKEDRQQLNNLQKELRDFAKQTDELKKKVSQLTEDNKNLSRALDREVGEGVTVDQAVDGGWRGRAQHIVMLKAKIKKLEQAAAENNGTASASRTTRNPNDVDVKAQGDIQFMGNERRRIVEALTEEREGLMASNSELEKKNQAYKSRINILEGEVRKFKENLQFVLDKSANDDELLEALKEEVARNKVQLAKAQQQISNNAASSTQRRELSSGGGELREERLQTEINRLQRLCKNQAEQIDSQDLTIRQLKKNFNL